MLCFIDTAPISCNDRTVFDKTWHCLKKRKENHTPLPYALYLLPFSLYLLEFSKKLGIEFSLR